ncbi:MAG: hypothetical protein BEN18_10765 [Epulopiscium sp. Nuni2H_MBin001]|nr:MAG: hypothetical protein BEN18_10765 [Epulopiscium sp. Nuni2H_MBin001]
MKKLYLLPICVGLMLMGCSDDTPVTSEIAEEIVEVTPTYWEKFDEIFDSKDLAMQYTFKMDIEAEDMHLPLEIGFDIQFDADSSTCKMEMNIPLTQLMEVLELPAGMMPDTIDVTMYSIPDVGILVDVDTFSLMLPLDFSADYINIGQYIDFNMDIESTATDPSIMKDIADQLGMEFLTDDNGQTYYMDLSKDEVVDMYNDLADMMSGDLSGLFFDTSTLSQGEVDEVTAMVYDLAQTINDFNEVNFNQISTFVDDTLETQYYLTMLSDEVSVDVSVDINQTNVELEELVPAEDKVIISIEDAYTQFYTELFGAYYN